MEESGPFTQEKRAEFLMMYGLMGVIPRQHKYKIHHNRISLTILALRLRSINLISICLRPIRIERSCRHC